jgi:hypothetical protein
MYIHTYTIYSKTLILCSPILFFPQFYALLVWSWPNAHKKDVSGFYAISRLSPKNIKSGFYSVCVCVCVCICVLILNMEFSAWIEWRAKGEFSTTETRSENRQTNSRYVHICCGVIGNSNYSFGAGIKHRVYSEKAVTLQVLGNIFIWLEAF